MSTARLLAATSVLTLMAGAAHAEFNLTILHTNDFHSRIEPINKYDSNCSAEDDAEGACFGGSARLDTAIKAQRALIEEAGGNVILVDGGDQFQGSLFYTYYKGKAAAEMMNALGYDGMTVGNHEFDDGPEVLRGFMDAIEFPILLANADVSNEPSLADTLLPSIVIERGGEKIGLVGLTPVDTPEIASPGPNITFSDPVPALQAEVERLTADGVTKVIALSHSGYFVDRHIAKNVSGVDVIVGGHSNTFLSNISDDAAGPYPTMIDGPDGNPTAVVQAYAYGKYLGMLNVTWNDDGTLKAAEGEPILMDGSIAENAELKARIAELAGPLDEIRDEIVAEAADALDGDRANCRVRECTMGNLVADAMLDRVKDQGIDIAIMNSGGIRASIDAGPVTMGEVLTVLPFQNLLATFELTGADVIAALENGVSQVEEVKGRFAQVAGLRYSWSPSVAPMEGRIQSVEVMQDGAWVPIDPAATYGVVSNNFLRSGGDGYSVFADNAINAYDFGPNLENVMADFMAASGAYQPILEDRITQVN